MFEQPLYEFVTVATPLKEGDLFHGYEIKNWVLTSRIYKILGISALLNIAAIVFVAQTSLLTLKGCDSPLVGSVCQVLDTVYVGSLLFGTQRDFVDVKYDRTDLGDAEITYIDANLVSPPLSYPAGYFQIANPGEQFALVDNSVDDLAFTNGIPGIPSGIPITKPSTGNSLFDTPPVVPRTNPNVIDGDLPTAGNSSGGIQSPVIRRKKNRGGRIAPPPVNDDGSVPGIPGSGPGTVAETDPPEKDPNADKKVDPTAPVSDTDINKRPFVDLANLINELVDTNQVKLDSPFLINASGKLDKNAKFDQKSFKYLKTVSADENILKVVKRAIEAMSESGYLQYLKQLSGKDLAIQIVQDDQNVSAVIQSEFETDLRANTMSALLSAFIDSKKKAKESPEADQNDKDDLVLLQNAAVTATGKKIVISFNIPKADIQQMIQRKLAEQKAQPKQPNSNAVVKPSENSSK